MGACLFPPPLSTAPPLPLGALAVALSLSLFLFARGQWVLRTASATLCYAEEKRLEQKANHRIGIG
eukprot:854538-Pleurochrysis_carterae.AAC.2